MNELVLFSLLRLGLDNSKPEQENLSSFIMLPAEQWKRLGEIAQEQGVLGVVVDGIDRMEATGYHVTRKLSREQRLEWIGSVLNGYEARNQHQLEVIADLQNRWAENGLRMMVMKGQAIGTYYPSPAHRAPGDIDCYLFDGYAKGNEVAKAFADNANEDWYKHSQIRYNEELIENHRFFVHTREGKSSKCLEKELLDTLKVEELDRLPDSEVLLPPPMFNAIFLTYHAMTHFLEEGLKLKQILDWAMFLKRDADKVDWPKFYRVCDKFHLRRFADVTTDIAVHYLGVKINNTQITETSLYTQKVLHSTLYDKDYVFSSGKRGWANRWHIVKNLFKYRWKFHQIYQHTVLRQLWFFTTGYLFKTE